MVYKLIAKQSVKEKKKNQEAKKDLADKESVEK